jgi:hypothetical protein
MKIYFNIPAGSDLLDLIDFCTRRIIPTNEIDGLSGIYCLDNVAHIVGYPSMDEVNQIPKSFILKWDPKHIGDLYDNKIIGRFNQGKMQWTMMDFKAMEPMIQVLMYGAKKYDRDNWKKACPKKLDLLDSLERHFVGLVAGESVDSESGLPHIGHLMCNAMFYSYWEQKTNGLFENFEEPTK